MHGNEKKKINQYIYESSDCNFSKPVPPNSQHFINKHHEGTEMTQINAKKNSTAVARTNATISHVLFLARVFRTEPCARYPKTKRIHPGGTLPHSLPCPSTPKAREYARGPTSTAYYHIGSHYVGSRHEPILLQLHQGRPQTVYSKQILIKTCDFDF